MFDPHYRRLRRIVFGRRLSAPSSGSARLRAFQRKRAEQTRVEGEQLAREKREQRIRDKHDQQKQAREELASYEPWGRAGGGAPNMRGVRFSNIRALGIFPEDELKSWSSPQRRRRTPLRLREDPQLYFADILRQSVDNDIRYKQTPKQQQAYKQILDNDLFSKIKGDHRIRKRTLFTLPDLQNGDECKDIITTKKKEDKDLDKLPNIKPNRTEYCANYCDKNEHQNNVKYKSKNATSTQSKKQKFVKRLSNGERLIKKFPEEINSNGENLDEKKLTPEATILRLTGGVELVPLLARRRRVGARTLPSSDVTRPPEQSCLYV
ncbi:unnamed protein product [Leptidea sinapis]|uniref:Uncharacterized protein n=1 Tax=Leptidea sinapis TaxID=189913 RepID=A0A5E4QKR9_9NEOP|nr:unnamed protein product [Leptidea sinapis]